MVTPCHFRSPFGVNSRVPCIAGGIWKQMLPSCIDAQETHSSVLCWSASPTPLSFPFLFIVFSLVPSPSVWAITGPHNLQAAGSWLVQAHSAAGSSQSQQARWFAISSHSCQLVSLGWVEWQFGVCFSFSHLWMPLYRCLLWTSGWCFRFSRGLTSISQSILYRPSSDTPEYRTAWD